MPLANDLLEQAYHLAKREPKRPRQASLRRAVSASYYALFHLLISEATRNWKQSHQRPALGRYFEHGKMANASNKQKAYQHRQTADYDTQKQWTRTEALAIIDSVDAAFKAWPQIRNHKLAQFYLFSLLGDPKGR